MISLEVVLPTGELLEVGQGGGRKIRRSSTGYRLKDLFLVPGTLGIATEGHPGAVPAARGRVPGLLRLRVVRGDGYRAMQPFCRSNLATLAKRDPVRRAQGGMLRRDDEAYIPEQVAPVDRGRGRLRQRGEVAAARGRLMRIGAETGGRYLGEELSELDWASRHDRYATPLHGRSATEPST